MMVISDSIIEQCLAQIRTRRDNAERIADEHNTQLCRLYPEYAKIDAEIKGTFDRIREVLTGTGDVESKMKRIQTDNMEAQKRRTQLLFSIGKDISYIRPQYICQLCDDTGYVENKRCECLKKLINAYNCKALNDASPLSLSHFDTYDLGMFSGSDAAHMKRVFDFVKSYADSFGEGSKNLLFYGDTGLGKTHLSLAVADDLISRGYNVIYVQACTLFNTISDERFSRDSVSRTEQAVLDCDLLIIDDLGAEFISQLNQSVFYNILNTRLLTSKPMIISTNSKISELDTLYHKRITSRLSFEFEPVPFVGNDVRQTRKHLQ